MIVSAAPTTIAEYLEQLRAALAGADPALVQDALYDAEEYLRSELVEQAASSGSGRTEADVISAVALSYGAPEEVADIYRDTEVKVSQALRAPPPKPRSSALGRFFGVAADPRAYAALFYMLLSMATGIFFFTWVVTGVSLSLGLAVLIIGIPFVILFFGSIRLLALVEGRLVEAMLGERMPRRPLYVNRGLPLIERIKAMFTDPRSWSTLLYMLLMLPLGIAYFTIAVSGIAVALSLIIAPVLHWLGADNGELWLNGMLVESHIANWSTPFVLIAGVLLLFVVLHVARGIGRLHGQLAKHLLVRTAQHA